jgi:flagellar assembly protein FliH
MERFRRSQDETVVGVPYLTEMRRPAPVMTDPQQTLAPRAFEFSEFTTYTPQPGELDVRTYAEQLVDDARAKAEEMVEQARQVRDSEIAAARQQGFEAGYASGYAEGSAAADREAAGLISTAEQIAMQVAGEHQRVVLSAERDVVELAIDIAGKLMNVQLEVDPDRIVEILRGAIRKAFQRDELTVLANPADLEVLRAAGPEIQRTMGGIQHLDFVEERRIERGSIVVRTPTGEVDATFAGKRSKLLDAFNEVAEQRRAQGEADAA